MWRETWFERTEDRGDSTSGQDSGSIDRQERPLVRVAQLYVWSRVGVAVALQALLLALRGTGSELPSALWWVSSAYLLQTVWMARPLRGVSRRSDLTLLSPSWSWATLGVDLLTFSAMDLMSPASSSFEVLLVMPVLMAGMLLGRLLGLATASAVALFMLSEVFWGHLMGSSNAPDLGRAGLLGMGFMVVAWFSVDVSQRLNVQEARAQFHRAQTEQQVQLNRLVMDEMAQGALLIDRQGRLQAANRAAQALLGLPEASVERGWSTSQWPFWPVLAEAVEAAFAQGHWPESGRSVVLKHGDGQPWPVKLRIRFARMAGLDEQALAPREADLCVLFIEDERQVQILVQQEKLAAMGRMLAGMAHEIRNPLAAITQAGALLGEESLPPYQRRLLGIIDTNASRLQRLVSEVLEAVPVTTSEPQRLPMPETLLSMHKEWRQLQMLSGDAVELQGPERISHVLFDPEHLRRVLVNLLDNAWRHSSQLPGAVRLSWSAPEGDAWTLRVFNDGPAVAPGVQPRLFEPFFSTRSRGSGLGLYLCRELSERYGGRLQFEPVTQDPRFRVCFALTLRCAPVSLEL